MHWPSLLRWTCFLSTSTSRALIILRPPAIQSLHPPIERRCVRFHARNILQLPASRSSGEESLSNDGAGAGAGAGAGDSDITDRKNQEEEETLTIGADLNFQWKEFRSQLHDNDLFDPQVSTRDMDPDSLLPVAFFFLLSVVFLGAIFINVLYQQDSNTFSQPTGSLEDDVDSAKGRFEALTGGVWF